MPRPRQVYSIIDICGLDDPAVSARSQAGDKRGANRRGIPSIAQRNTTPHTEITSE